MVVQGSFEPIHAATPSGTQLRTQRSLLAELLASSSNVTELGEDDVEEEPSVRVLPPARTSCTCGLGQGVLRAYHPLPCALHRHDETCDAPFSPSGIAIPSKTYYKLESQVAEQRLIQRQRALYRAKQEQAGHVQLAVNQCQ
ncbi:hypothetical protein HYH03_008673 [Edaphochlamys debaryana]|uniref:Uncharacterized protein n=1 Tax=Edaphochlamys debaryana TaxID=47281 RepID=A0A835Y5T1_9CHLO|nr:hypothetical protein HYH03_008673 [Edaphochlamys debaryana]|eukprot:KAG2493010.1 hypothetical protein HYH03_008673 [Edaphochlamys debaryana]